MTRAARSQRARTDPSACPQRRYRSGVLRTLRQPRWIGLSVVVVILCLAFGRLGLWQWHRAQGKWAANDALAAAARAEPVPAAEVLAVDASPPKAAEWRQ